MGSAEISTENRKLSGDLFISFAMVYCAAYAVLVSSFYFASSPGELVPETNLLVDALFAFPVAVALGCAALAVLRSEMHKQTWMLVFIALLFWLAPEILNIYLIDLNEGFVDPLVASNINLLYYGFFLFFPLAILTRVYMRLKTGFRRLGMLIDVGLVISTMLGLFSMILELRSTGSLLNGYVLAIGYVLFAVSVLFAIYFGWMKLHGAGLQVWEKYLVFALGILVMANIFYFLKTDIGLYRHGSVYEAGWLIGAFFIAASALVDSRLMSPSFVTHSLKPKDKPLTQMQVRPVSPLIIGAINLLTLYFVVTNPEGDATVQIAAFLGAAAVFASVRFFLTLRENAFLKSNTYRDLLTNVYSKDFFVEMLEHQYESAKRYENELILMIVDVDNFRSVTGDVRYQYGEKVLGKIATIIGLLVRRADIISRVGGDEFAIIMPEAHSEQCPMIAERIRVAIVEEMSREFTDHKITVSIGVSNYPKIAEDPKALYRTASEAVKVAKAAGKNRSAIAGQVTAVALSDSV